MPLRSVDACHRNTELPTGAVDAFASYNATTCRADRSVRLLEIQATLWRSSGVWRNHNNEHQRFDILAVKSDVEPV